jgi:hypothetical protein
MLISAQTKAKEPAEREASRCKLQRVLERLLKTHFTLTVICLVYHGVLLPVISAYLTYVYRARHSEVRYCAGLKITDDDKRKL